MAIPPAPSAPPTSVSVSEVTSSSITVQWGPVDCIHRNGDIISYSVQYGEVGSGSTQTIPVSGGSATEATISSLMLSTTYSVQVAAMNSAGTGPYTSPLTIETPYNSKHISYTTAGLKYYCVCPTSLISVTRSNEQKFRGVARQKIHTCS